jgi:hypothetical protein
MVDFVQHYALGFRQNIALFKSYLTLKEKEKISPKLLIIPFRHIPVHQLTQILSFLYKTRTSRSFIEF